MDHTISTLSHEKEPRASEGIAADELLLLVECDRPTAGSTRHRLGDIDEVVIGRGPSRTVTRAERRLTVLVPDGRISTTHARLRRDGASFVLEDLGAKNGVIVNGLRVERHLLRDGEVIECGRTFFRFHLGRTRPRDEAVDLEVGADRLGAVPGLTTLYEPLAEQLRALADVSRRAIPVLILGPTGSGKELIARAVHAMSQRPGAFVGVNCGALPSNLVEAELFGARRGAFTGAHEDRAGLVRASDAGTLFLDEIGDLPLTAQPAFLRTLQEREVLPVGATKPVPVDLRLVAATHHDLQALVGRQRFRADLLARISGFVVRLPRLRDRLDDLGILIAMLLERHRLPGDAVPTIAPEAMRLLLRYDWPLNVRELEHCLRAALVLGGARIEAANLPEAVRLPPGQRPAPTPSKPRTLTAEQEALRDQLRALLAEHGGNISQVARVLHKDRVQIRRWIRMFALAPSSDES